MKVKGTNAMKSTTNDKAPVVVDLFCGAGGLSYGMQSAGLKIAAGIDLDPSCKFAIESNTDANFVCEDITNITPEQINGWFGKAKIRVLAGCAPCQPFSTYSQSRKSEDDRWNLLLQFQRLALATLPEIVTMENVVGLAKQDVWNGFVSALEAANYDVSWRVVQCEKFGIPQTRRRLVLLASRLGPISLPNPNLSEIQTVKNAIGDLPAIIAGERSSEDPLHASASLTDVNLERIKRSRQGGTWRDWPESLRASCHKKATGKTYPSVYGRMEWDRPAPTMTTQCYGYGNGRFGHPEQNRAISLREAAIIQSFPKSYRFLKDEDRICFNHLGTLIGNAVPPKLGEAIGSCILKHLSGDVSSAEPKQIELL